jgi:acetyl esterase/lipase
MASDETRGAAFVDRKYGEHPSQFVRVWKARSGDAPVVLLVHGGFWKSEYGLDTAAGTACETLAPDLMRRGFAPVEVEYRRGDDGCYPAANLDIVAAVRFVNSQPARTAIVGMSAGGQLALWAALEVDSAQRPGLIVAISPVADLELAVQLRLSDRGDAVQRYLAATTEALYRAASPMHRVPEFDSFASSIFLVSGARDIDVPPKMVKALHDAIPGSAFFLDPDADHYALMNADSNAWNRVAAEIEQRILLC